MRILAQFMANSMATQTPTEIYGILALAILTASLPLPAPLLAGSAATHGRCHTCLGCGRELGIPTDDWQRQHRYDSKNISNL